MPVPWESDGLDELYFYTRIRVRQWLGGEILVLIVEGHLGTEGAAQELTQLLVQAASQGARGAVLDLRLVTFLPSRVLPSLISLRTRLAKRGGILAVVAPSDRINRLLGLVGMEKAIFMCSDPEAAYAAVKKSAEG